MELRDFALKTKKIYLKMVENLAKYYNKSPDILTQVEIEDFIIYLMNVKKMASSSINVYISAFKFLYNTVIEDDSVSLDLPKKRTPK